MAIDPAHAAAADRYQPSGNPPPPAQVSPGIGGVAMIAGQPAYVFNNDKHAWEPYAAKAPNMAGQGVRLSELPEYQWTDNAWHLVRGATEGPKNFDGRYLLDEKGKGIGLILEVDHRHIGNVDDLTRELAAVAPGSKVDFTVLDDGKPVTISRVVGHAQAQPEPQAQPRPQPSIAAVASRGLQNLNETDQKELKGWAAIIAKDPWLLPKNAEEKAAWLELAAAVNNAVKSGDWKSVDEIAGRNPKLGDRITHEVNKWQAYWHQESEKTVAKRASDASYGRVAEVRTEAMTKWDEFAAANKEYIENNNYLEHTLKKFHADDQNEIGRVSRQVEAMRMRAESARDEVVDAVRRAERAEAKEGVPHEPIPFRPIG